jgi:hypothetical protein
MVPDRGCGSEEESELSVMMLNQSVHASRMDCQILVLATLAAI